MNSVATLQLIANEGMSVARRKAFRSRIDNNMTRGEGRMEEIITTEDATTTEMIAISLTIESNPRDCPMSCT